MKLKQIFILLILIGFFEPVWAERNVYLLGIAEMDDDPWVLPSSSH